MTRSQSLEAQLLSTSAITTLVGSRIYPLQALPPDGKTVLLYKMMAHFLYTLSGVNLVKISPLLMLSYSVDYDVAHQLADAVRAVLSPVATPKGFTGLLGGTGGVDVIGCRIEREEEDFIAITPDQGVFEVRSEYVLEYKAA